MRFFPYVFVIGRCQIVTHTSLKSFSLFGNLLNHRYLYINKNISVKPLS